MNSKSVRPRIFSIAINEDDRTSLLVLEVDMAGYFELNAARHGIIKNEIDRMASAFEHVDLKKNAQRIAYTNTPTFCSHGGGSAEAHECALLNHEAKE
jgi:hypothetical protein